MTNQILPDNQTVLYAALVQIATDDSHPLSYLFEGFKVTTFHRLAELQCGVKVSVNPKELISAINRVKK
jgi:hypothetical protein